MLFIYLFIYLFATQILQEDILKTKTKKTIRGMWRGSLGLPQTIHKMETKQISGWANLI